MADPVSVVRVAAVGDLHCSKNSQGLIRPLFENSDKFADVLVLCGDLTDYGLPDEAQLLVEELSVASKLPIVAVLGNHDFESGREETLFAVRCVAYPLTRAVEAALSGRGWDVLQVYRRCASNGIRVDASVGRA